MRCCLRCYQWFEDAVERCPGDGRPLEAPCGPGELGGQVLGGRFRVLCAIGAGGVGVVYLAEHVKLRRKVVVKLLNPAHAGDEELRRRLDREARLAGLARHPGIVPATDIGEHGGRPYVVMDYVPGPTLTQRLLQPMALREAVRVVLEVLDALGHAHGLGIVHRDLKPDNIMLSVVDGRIRLLDFGMAKNIRHGAPGSTALTKDGIVFGTPGYLAPERIDGLPADPRSDVYSVGIVLYRLVCGRKPFEAEEMVEVLRAHLQDPPPPPRMLNPRISRELEDVLLKALAKDPAARFPEARTFHAELTRVPEARQGAEATPPPPPRRRPRSWLWVALVASCLGLVGVGLLLFLRAPGDDRAARAEAAVAEGHEHSRAGRCDEALGRYRRALELAPLVRGREPLIRRTIDCLDRSPAAGVELLVRIGTPARRLLRQATASHPSGRVRARARYVLETLSR